MALLGRSYTKPIVLRGADDSAPPPPAADSTTQPLIAPALDRRPWRFNSVIVAEAPLFGAPPPPPSDALPWVVIVRPAAPAPARSAVLLAAASAEIWMGGGMIITAPRRQLDPSEILILRGLEDPPAPPDPGVGPVPEIVTSSRVARRATTLVAKGGVDPVLSTTPAAPAMIVKGIRRAVRRAVAFVFKAPYVAPVPPAVGIPDTRQPTRSVTVDRQTYATVVARTDTGVQANRASEAKIATHDTIAQAHRSSNATVSARSTTVQVEP